MASIDDMTRLYQQISSKLEAASPMTEALQRAVLQNHTFITKMLLPYDAIARQVEALNRAITPPSSFFIQMQSVLAQYENSIPLLAKNFEIASAVFDSIRAVDFRIPEYISRFNYDCSPLLKASNALRDTYDSLLATVAERTVVPEIAPAVIIKPSLSTAGQFRTLRSLGFSESHEHEPIDNDFNDVLTKDWDETERVVAETEPLWLIPLKGAEESFLSANPEKVRHTITSLRELLTQILHRFAPDDMVHEQLPEGKWYHEGKPTRRARLMVILTKKHGSDLLLDFLDKDIDAALEMFELFQQGTHEIVSNISPAELKFILARAKVLIGELIVNGRSDTS